jgi:hypothetical protein
MNIEQKLERILHLHRDKLSYSEMKLYVWLLSKQNISPMVNSSWIFCMYNVWKTESEKQQAKRLWQGIRR